MVVNVRSAVVRTILIVTVAGLTACSNTFLPPETAADESGVSVTTKPETVRGCYALGDFRIGTMTFNELRDLKAETARMGGDTLLYGGEMFAGKAYVCRDHAKIAASTARDAAIEKVRITNRQDVVARCEFIKNADARSEADARAQTVDLGGDLFYVLSDTSRTAEEKAAGSKTTYNYEVRRLTGEVYRCAAGKKP